MKNNFANFINDMIEDISNDLQAASEKLLIQDIIMLYNNSYNNNNHYTLYQL